MAYEILGAKLCEMDEKIRRLHSRIHLCESAQHSRLSGEIEALREECAATGHMLEKELKDSHAGSAARLAGAYMEIEHLIERTREEICGRSGENDEADETGSGETAAEKKILYAEYSLDFALQAANRAVLSAMEAIDEQITQQEREEGNV